MKRIAIVDPGIRPGFAAALEARLPAGWAVTSDPVGAAVLVTENADVGSEILRRAGEGVRLLVKLDPGKAGLEPGAVPVLEVPNTALLGVAEHTVALLLACVRRLVAVDARTRAREYVPDRAEPILTDQKRYTYNWIGLEDFGTLYRRRVGLVGLGLIGRAVAARLRPFGVRLVYTQRTRLPETLERELGVTYLSLTDLLATSDIVSLHHRFDESENGNDGQFGSEAFAAMKTGAVFINTARGRLVDEDALAAALRSGHLSAAGLDVFRHEPLPEGHPFFDLPSDRLLLTPHVAGGPVDEAWGHMADDILEAALSLVKEQNHG